MIRLSLFTLLLMTGCTTVVPANPIHIDEGLLVECGPIPLIPTDSEGRVSMGDLLIADVELVAMYEECKAKHGGIVKILRGNQ